MNNKRLAMKSPTKLLILLGAVIFLMTQGCTRDELNMDKFSRMVKVERDIALPLAHGEMFLKDIIGANTTDSIATINGDTVFYDTLNLSLEMDKLEVDFCELHYVSKNYLPLGFNLRLISYDSITNSILDTILFSNTGLFMEAAPLDSDGNVIESQVQSKEDVISINSSTADNLLHRATHLIFQAELFSNTKRIIPLTEKNYIWLDLGIAAHGSYTSEIE